MILLDLGALVAPGWTALLLVVILGDNFPFTDPPDALQAMYALEDHPQFKKLGEPEKAIAMAEFQELLQSKKVNGNTALALGEESGRPQGRHLLRHELVEARALGGGQPLRLAPGASA